MRVLLADADEFAELVQCFLWDSGHEAEIVRDGVECITILEEFLPHVVVIDGDLLWGGCDGVVQWLAEHPLLSEIPVIVTDGGAVRRIGTESRDSPIPRLAKPYRLGQILDVVNAAARFVPMRRAPAAENPTDVATFFVQTCPACDRWLSLPVQRLGESSRCQYCGGAFVAVQSPDGRPRSVTAQGSKRPRSGDPLQKQRKTCSFRDSRN